MRPSRAPFLGAGALVGVGPPNQAALPFWLDGFDIDLQRNALLTNGGAIGSWKNKGYLGAAMNVSQASTGLKALFTLAAISGHPAALFTATKLFTSTASAVAQSAARHVFIMLDVASGSGLYAPRGGGTGYNMEFGSSGVEIETNNTTTNTNLAVAPSAGKTIVEYYFDGVSANKLTLVVNGTTMTVTNGAGSGSGVEGATAGTTIGAAAGGITSYLGEILCYDALQTAANPRAYLTAKWA